MYDVVLHSWVWGGLGSPSPCLYLRPNFHMVNNVQGNYKSYWSSFIFLTVSWLEAGTGFSWSSLELREYRQPLLRYQCHGSTYMYNIGIHIQGSFFNRLQNQNVNSKKEKWEVRHEQRNPTFFMALCLCLRLMHSIIWAASAVPLTSLHPTSTSCLLDLDLD